MNFFEIICTVCLFVSLFYLHIYMIVVCVNVGTWGGVGRHIDVLCCATGHVHGRLDVPDILGKS